MKFRGILFLSAIFLMFFLLALVFTVFLDKDGESFLLEGSTYSAKPKGYKAFYLLLKEMGFDARRWQIPLDRLKEDKHRGQVMVVIDAYSLSPGGCRPSGPRKEAKDIAQVFNWAEAGNTLLLVGYSPYFYSKDLQIQIPDSKICKLDFEEETDRADDKDKKVTVEASLPTTYCRGVGKIKLSECRRFKCARDDKVVHFQDIGGEIVASIRHGKGKIILISDPYISSNQGIAEEGNCYLLSNIIFNDSSSKVVYFDEFHHGFHAQKGLFSYFKGTSLAWVFLQFLLVAGFYFYSQGRHFGAPKNLITGQRRSILEYVDAMAAIFQKAQAHRLGLIGIYRRYKALWLRALGFGASWDIGQFSLTVARRINRDRVWVEKIFKECEEVLKGRPISKGASLSLAEELQKLRKELEDAGIY